MQLHRPTPWGGGWGITLIGVALGVAALAYGTAVDRSGAIIYPLVEFLLLFGLSATVALSGYWLGQSDVDDELVWEVAMAVGLGVILMATIVGWLLLEQLRLGSVIEAPLAALVVVQTVGAVLGLLVGVYHVESVRAARRVERAEAAAAEAREASDQLEFLNDLLRHHLLNGVQVIRSYTTLLDDHVDRGGAQHLATIQRRSDRLVALVDNIRVLVRSLSEEDQLGPQPLADAIESELEVLRDTYERATFEVEGLDEETMVRADCLLPAVFENLFRNAVEHNTHPDPTVKVEVSEHEETVTVDVADNGPGVDHGIEEQFLAGAAVRDPVAEQGTGLYIVNRLVTTYGGEVHVEETGPGATFELELRLASDADADAATTE